MGAFRDGAGASHVLTDASLHSIAALIQQGAHADAHRQLTDCLVRHPGHVAAHRLMAQLASRTGRTDLAIRHMSTACELSHGSLDDRYQVACLLAHSGEMHAALPHFLETTVARPEFVDAWYLLGVCLVRLGRLTEALNALHTACRLAPEQRRVLQALADVEFRVGFPADAFPLWQELLRQHPDEIDARLKTGETLSRLGEQDQAIALYRAGIEAQPDSSALWMALGQAEEDDGRREAARQAFERAAELRPDWAFPVASLLSLCRDKAPLGLIRQAQGLLAAVGGLSDEERSVLGYELGKVHDARGEYADALRCWRDANAARQRQSGMPDPAQTYQLVDRTIAAAARKRFTATGPHGSDDPRCVFIVGMPRSGTTLTEQIIASHPLAFGCGELPDIALIARTLPSVLGTATRWPEIMDHLDPRALAWAAERYTSAISRHAPASALRLVDKAPLNFFHLGLVAVMFPNARVIWCRRDPRDVAISIHGENFALDAPMATSMEATGHYINAQHRLMRHWQDVLPLPILELEYEALVSSPEPQARRVMEFLDLPWDPACLNFHKSDRGVQTPSRWQVRQPMHIRSIGRWRHYEELLRPLLKALDPRMGSAGSDGVWHHA